MLPTIFTMDAAEKLTNEKLKEFIDSHAARTSRYTQLQNMYLGKHEILDLSEKGIGKPDNRLVVNFARYIVDTLNGYFVGNPIKTVHPDKATADQMKLIAKRNSQNNNNAELSKMCSIYGHAYEFMYMDEQSDTRVTFLSPQQGFIIYDDTIAQNPLYGVRVLKDKEGKLTGTIYSRYTETEFYVDDKSELIQENPKDHYFGDVPLIEYVENEERQSAFEGVISLINAFNKAISEKANDVDYFADAYLAILGVGLEEGDLEKVRDNRIINLKDGDSTKITVEFLDKPNADSTQENLINRLQDLIFQIAMVANISDEKFGSSSGIALKYKLQPMENIALMKERKFTAGMMKRFGMMFTIPTNFNVAQESYLDIDYVFSRNMPNDLVDEASAVSNLEGIVSKRTQLSALSIVDNVQDELDEIEKEAPERMPYDFPRTDVTADGEEE